MAIIILFVASTIPVLAEGPAIGSGKGKVVLPFQPIADTMKLNKAKPKNQWIAPSHQPITWQGMKDDWKKGREDAQKESLRTPKTAAAVTK
jgi:hypothetical protein